MNLQCKSLLVAIFIIVSIFLCSLSTPSQQSQNPSRLVELRPKSGILKGLAESKLISRTESGKVNGEGSASIYLSILESKDIQFLIADAPRPILARLIHSYDVEGKAFCYLFEGPCVGVHKKKGGIKEIVVLGCRTTYAYYDEDGDGRFERIENYPGFWLFKLHIPESLLKSKGE